MSGIKTTQNATPTFYPSYLFAHSATYTSWARLTCADVQHRLFRRPEYASHDSKELWFFAETNHPIRWVRIVGIVVAVDEWESRTQLTIDDGSGEVMDVITWKTPRFRDAESGNTSLPNLSGVQVGALVKVKGCITEFKGRRQMVLKKCEVLRSTEDEIRAWREMTDWKRNVLMKLWVVDDRTIKREKRRMRARAREELSRKKKKAQDEGGDGKRILSDGHGSDGKDGTKEFRGRRRPEGYLPPPIPKSLALVKNQGDSEKSRRRFKGKRRPEGYVPLPKPLERSKSPDIPPVVVKSKKLDHPDDGNPAATKQSPGTAVESKSDITTSRGRKRPHDHKTLLKSPPSSEAQQATVSRGSRSPASKRARPSYSDFEFDGVNAPTKLEDRKLAELPRKATLSIVDQSESLEKSVPSVASDPSSGRRRRIRIVPAGKAIPPPVPVEPQQTPVQAQHDAYTLRFSKQADETAPPLPFSSFRGRRRPGTIQSGKEPQSQQPPTPQQKTSGNQKGFASTQISSTIATIETLPTFKGRRRAQPEGAAQIPANSRGGGTSAHLQPDSYSTSSSQLPTPSQPPLSTFRGRRRELATGSVVNS
ncbi:hypothetical protein FN846DRAFT_888059 [Sphaerosporella brunnea]|uniref:CST complex subunit STN1 n=1 Tax=Sphaerosporella brunnea TaxID=1250544 RepID=A0A5J5F3Q3_9PEZI|nr:hypothetical protein FN846DRAFT_888059 [Sphaerosporella brunnea]